MIHELVSQLTTPGAGIAAAAGFIAGLLYDPLRLRIRS